MLIIVVTYNLCSFWTITSLLSDVVKTNTGNSCFKYQCQNSLMHLISQYLLYNFSMSNLRFGMAIGIYSIFDCM
jgi:hypothetical protein